MNDIISHLYHTMRSRAPEALPSEPGFFGSLPKPRSHESGLPGLDWQVDKYAERGQPRGGGRGAEQDGRGERGQGDGEGDETVTSVLQSREALQDYFRMMHLHVPNYVIRKKSHRTFLRLRSKPASYT